MEALAKVLESQTKIRFQDCDPFNHLNNANYINYMINGREDQIIQHYDLDIYKMARTIGKSWVSSKNQIAYLKPAFLMETVTIDSQLIQYIDTELLVEIRMWNENKSQLKAVLWASFVHFDLLKQKRTIHNDELLGLFTQVILPINQTDFDKRVQQLSEQLTTSSSN